MSEPIILAFSGGLDTSWCVPWLRENHDADVITVFVDLGGLDDAGRDALAERSKALGAVEHIHIDARETFYHTVLRYLIAGNVTKGNLYPLCVGAERGLQAAEVARVALSRGAGAIVHGCTAAGNDQVRFEIALTCIAPGVKVWAPIRDQAPTREEEVAFLESRGFPVPGFGAAYSINSGIWGVTIGGAETTGTTESIPEEAWVRTRGAFDAPKAPQSVVLSFKEGQPVAIDGEAMEPVALIEHLDALAASFGVGRGIHLGDTILGSKGRVAFEAPAATVLLTAHRELEKLTLSADQQQVKDSLAAKYGALIHEGRYLEAACRDIEALFVQSQSKVTGDVRVLLRAGSVFIEGVSSPYSLHAACSSVYGEEAIDWSPADARGFIRIIGLPLDLQARAHKGKGVAS